MNSIIICAIYAVAKLFKIEVTFVQLLGAFESLYPESLSRTKYNICLFVEEVEMEVEKGYGNIIEFYNSVFVVVNTEYLTEMKKNIPIVLNELNHRLIELNELIE